MPLNKIKDTFYSLILQSINLRKSYKIVKNLEEFIYKNKLFFDKNSIGLDLGCGVNPRNIFNIKNMYGVDIRSNNIDLVKEANLSIDKIPFEDNTFDFCTAFDFIEHIPRQLYVESKLTLPFIFAIFRATFPAPPMLNLSKSCNKIGTGASGLILLILP